MKDQTIRCRALTCRGLRLYDSENMRISIALITVMLLTACGHMAPYSEHRGANVESYNISGSVYLRVPYRVIVYDLVPRTYLDEEWIALGTSSNKHKLLNCAPGQRDIYREPTPMIGSVELKASKVNINLFYPSAEGAKKQASPYKFNGTWAFIEMKGLPPASPTFKQFGCK